MPNKIVTTHHPEILSAELELATAYMDKALIDAKIQGLKMKLVTLLREEEKRTGNKVASPNWALTRSTTTYKRTPSITLMKRYVTQEIIDRCCTTKRVEQPPLTRRTQKK
jgi:hypothetical protein